MMMARSRRTSTSLSVLCAASTLLLDGCGGTGRSPGTVVFASGADLESANPLVSIHLLSRQVQRYALFVTLARYDSMLEPEPYAARRWTWTADRQTLTFSLVPELRWHDGVPTLATDVAFTLEAARDPATGYPRHADLAEVQSVATPDDSTVVIRFARPQPRFPSVLCELPIVPAHLLASVPRGQMRQAPFSTAPVGNGPFRFAGRAPGQRWTFERNPHFPPELGGPPILERFIVAVVDEPATKFAGLVSGQLDAAGIPPSMAALAAEDPSLRVVDYPVLISYGLVFNTHRPPFDDARVRHAVGLAVDRQRVVDVALAGFAAPAAGPVPASHPFALPEVPLHDTARANALLDAAGWRRTGSGERVRAGQRLQAELLTVGSGDNAVEQLLQSDLASVGMRLEIRQREMGSFLAEARADEKRFDLLWTGIPGDLSLAYLSSIYDSRLAGSALDYGGFHTARLDTLLAHARTAASDSAARLAWHEVQRELASEMPTAWVYHARGLLGLARRLEGATMDLRGELATLARWSTRSQDDAVTAR